MSVYRDRGQERADHPPPAKAWDLLVTRVMLWVHDQLFIDTRIW